MSERPSVLLVFGGQSPEHSISCRTAAGVAKAIDLERYQVYAVAIDRLGLWHRMELAQVVELAADQDRLPSVPTELPSAFLMRSTDGVKLASISADTLIDQVPVDVALTLLHGSYGEDGTIQGMFEMLGLPYVGSSVSASAISMDKQFMKQACQAAGLPVGPYQVITDQQWRSDPKAAAARVVENLAFPVFVKPARAGSSIGITRVSQAADLSAAVEAARQHDLKVVVEQGFSGFREIECAVLGAVDEHGPRSSVVGEIVVHTEDQFYDFETKYLPKTQVDLQIPAQLDPAVVEQVRAMAVQVFEAVGAEGLARVDFFVFPQANNGPTVVVNEINTMPGFTPLSMFPSLWQATGIDYPDLIADLIEQAAARPLSVNR